jgi:hypothetical protein
VLHSLCVGRYCLGCTLFPVKKRACTPIMERYCMDMSYAEHNVNYSNEEGDSDAIQPEHSDGLLHVQVPAWCEI